jgi:hypothetical protein
MGRNAEAYVGDIVVNTHEGHTFIEDLEETFVNLRKPWGASSRGVGKKLYPSSSS